MVGSGRVKESVMQIPVAIEPTGLGGFRAQSVPPFTAVAEGNTREEAVSKVRDELNRQLAEGKDVVMVEVDVKKENPWLRIAGSLKGNPLYDEWQAAIKENRRQQDIEDGIETGDRS
jgi:hypothetical protein